MLKPWLLAARPKTLSASVVPVLIGTALAPRPILWSMFAFALIGALCIQIATNFVNDALDFRKGADTVERLGPTRVTQAGLISADQVLRAAYVFFTIAALCGIPLILRGGWPLLAIGLTSVAAAYIYTGGPYPLAYNGLGELFVMIFFGFVAVGGTYFVLTLQYTAEAAACGFAVGSLAVVILAINNLRDIAGDRASNKKTIATRIGERGARAEILLCELFAYAGVAFAAWRSGDWSLLLVFLSLPLAIALFVRVRRSSGREFNRCLAMAGALQWAFSLLFLVGSLL